MKLHVVMNNTAYIAPELRDNGSQGCPYVILFNKV